MLRYRELQNDKNPNNPSLSLSCMHFGFPEVEHFSYNTQPTLFPAVEMLSNNCPFCSILTCHASPPPPYQVHPPRLAFQPVPLNQPPHTHDPPPPHLRIVAEEPHQPLFPSAGPSFVLVKPTNDWVGLRAAAVERQRAAGFAAAERLTMGDVALDWEGMGITGFHQGEVDRFWGELERPGGALFQPPPQYHTNHFPPPPPQQPHRPPYITVPAPSIPTASCRRKNVTTAGSSVDEAFAAAPRKRARGPPPQQQQQEEEDDTINITHSNDDKMGVGWDWKGEYGDLEMF
ncbi:hypothetical protein BGZ60DRAFT_432275 [Tricladium varicosporioides]|nr:hypothetical protein BGZ60DRAFT_432275 [Hymenoscyphus varicosporioides]